MTAPMDEDAVMACADLVARTGATRFQIGYLGDDETDWYAYAAYKGTRIEVSGQPGPTEAADGLARRLLTGARCRCGKMTTLSDAGAAAFTSAALTDGTQWTAGQAAAAGQCRWRRIAARWEPGCPAR